MFLNFKFTKLSQVWWYIPIILALRRLRQADPEFEASLYYLSGPVSKQNKKLSQSYLNIFMGLSLNNFNMDYTKCI
jgi:hypothetical protein